MPTPLKEELHPDQYQGGQRTWNRRGGTSKDTAIKKAIERREKSIQGFADAKSTQIAVSSAFNGAAAIATALLQLGAIKESEYWDVQESWYYEYVQRYNSKQSEAIGDTQNKIGRKSDLFAENKETAAIDSAETDTSNELI